MLRFYDILKVLSTHFSEYHLFVALIIVLTLKTTAVLWWTTILPPRLPRLLLLNFVDGHGYRVVDERVGLSETIETAGRSKLDGRAFVRT